MKWVRRTDRFWEMQTIQHMIYHVSPATRAGRERQEDDDTTQEGFSSADCDYSEGQTGDEEHVSRFNLPRR